MSDKFIKTIYHVVKVNEDDSFIPTTKNIIYQKIENSEN